MHLQCSIFEDIFEAIMLHNYCNIYTVFIQNILCAVVGTFHLA